MIIRFANDSFVSFTRRISFAKPTLPTTSQHHRLHRRRCWHHQIQSRGFSFMIYRMFVYRRCLDAIVFPIATKPPSQSPAPHRAHRIGFVLSIGEFG